MNERIKQLLALADQMTLTAIVQTDIKFDSEDFNAIKFEKFAELLIRECADLCDRFQSRDVGMQPAECAGAIRNMFGVD